jgi:hypothetical protein
VKKVGFIVFITAIVIGVSVGDLFSFGKAEFPLKVSFNDRVEGSGNVVVVDRDLRNFDRIEVGGVFVVEVVAGKDHSIQIEADDNLLDHISTEVTGGTLSISMKEHVKSSNSIKVRITAPVVNGVEASGASNVTIAGISNPAFSIDASGAAAIEVKGTAEELIAEVTGASKLNADGLSATKAHIDASGASKVLLQVSEQLEVDSTGASSVIYSGDPTHIRKKTSGAASVSKR